MRLVFLLLPLLAVACSPPLPVTPEARRTAAVRLNVEPQESGDYLLTIENHARTPLGYNLCRSTLEREASGDWQRIDAPPCTADLHTLEPGRTASVAHRVERPLDAGVYRFTTTIERPLGGQQDTLSTDSFVVE